jgi:eukaryotic-like serine/threonine-protein kinase
MRDVDVGDTLDVYELTALLGRGGMATIFKAIDTRSGATVALKIPHLQYEADVVFYERFCREERAARQLDHPGVVKALAPPAEKSRMYMVMEYVDGVPLSSLLEDRRPLPTAQALDIARQTCDALAYLHAQGILHRDVKPGNVLVTRTGQVKLIDFGIAHVEAARRLTIAGFSVSFGTPDYMAPEQMRGRVGDARVDVYSLGTMLYQMTTGQLPYSAPDWQAMLRAKRLEQPTPPSAHVHDIDQGVEAIILRAIEPAPVDRYPAAIDMLADLRDPSAVPPRPRDAPGTRRGRRTDLRPVAAVLVVLAALSGVGGIAWLSHRRVLESRAAGENSRAADVAQRPPGQGFGSARP